MKAIKTEIEGLLIIEPDLHGDSRGYFLECWNQRDFRDATGLSPDFVQDNESRSRHGVVRGLHFQRPPFAQAKLVRVVEGRVLDVALDLRRSSPTYGRAIAVELSADNHRQLFLPRGMAHGFAVISDHATFLYKCDNFYNPQAEGGIAWNDPSLDIDWLLDPRDIILSPRDMQHPLLADFNSPFV